MSNQTPEAKDKKDGVDYRGRAAYVLAFSLGASIVVLSALAALDVFRTGELSPTTGGVLAAVFSGIIGAVATYMGGRASSSSGQPQQLDPNATVADYNDLVEKLTHADIPPVSAQVQQPDLQQYAPEAPAAPKAPAAPQAPAAPDDFPQVPPEYR